MQRFLMDEMTLMEPMTERQRMMFVSEMSKVRKDGTVGVLLALFLGGFGAHRFYLNQVGLGVVYVVFCWTLIPAMIAFVEIFLMSNRVRVYNEEHAQITARQICMMFPTA